MHTLNTNINTFLQENKLDLTGNVVFQVDDSMYLSSFCNDETIYTDPSLNKINISNLSIVSSIYKYYFELQKLYKESTDVNDLFYYSSNEYDYKCGPRVNDNPNFNKNIRYQTSLWLSSYMVPDTFIVFYNPKISFTEQFIEFPTNFIQKIIKESEIIYTSPTSFSNFLNNIELIHENSYELTEDTLTLYGISNLGYYREVVLPLPEEEITDELIISLFKENGLVSSKLINVDFYFDSEYDPKYLYGMYFNKEELSKFNLDFHKLKLKYPSLNELDLQLSNSYLLPIILDNITDIPYSYFENSFKDIFVTTPIITGDDYGFFDNEYCTTSEYQFIDGGDYNVKYRGSFREYNCDYTEYGEYGEYNCEYGPLIIQDFASDWQYNIKTATKVNDYYKLWLSEYGFGSTYNIKYESKLEDDKIYSIEDKNGNMLNVNNIDFEFNNIKVVKPELYLSDLLGVSNIEKSCTYEILQNYSDNNIILSLEKTNKYGPVLNTGDYFEVNLLDNRFRIIANPNKCCDDCTYDQKNEYTLMLSSCKFNFSRFKNSIMSEIKIDGFFKLEEGSIVKMTTSKFKNIEFEIVKYFYNAISSETIITLIDKEGTYFNDCYDIDQIILSYTQKPYYYKYFNNIGTIPEVLNSMKRAFDSFENNSFETFINFNSLIIKTLGQVPYYFKFDISKTTTPIENLKINEIPVSTYKYYDIDNDIIISRKRCTPIKLEGGNIYSKRSRLSISKNWAKENLDGTEILFNKDNYVDFKKYKIQDNILNYWNYLDDPIIFQKQIVGYININNYVICELDNNEYFYEDGSNLIKFRYKYVPKLLKLHYINTDIL